MSTELCVLPSDQVPVLYDLDQIVDFAHEGSGDAGADGFQAVGQEPVIIGRFARGEDTRDDDSLACGMQLSQFVGLRERLADSLDLFEREGQLDHAKGSGIPTTIFSHT